MGLSVERLLAFM